MRFVGSYGSVIQCIIQISVVQFEKDNMAVRFYQQLHNLSTADFLLENKKKREKFYEVERVISRRTRKRKVKQLSIVL